MLLKIWITYVGYIRPKTICSSLLILILIPIFKLHYINSSMYKAKRCKMVFLVTTPIWSPKTLFCIALYCTLHYL
jgi:hypothetical protein